MHQLKFLEKGNILPIGCFEIKRHKFDQGIPLCVSFYYPKTLDH